ncbi:MAG TPA: DoxX family protein [Caulobacteraceae bacterium]|nr:DoxX family protein [Caulobacteraceae bacterium]
MPRFVAVILESRITVYVGRVLLTLMFWSSGVAKVVDFKTGVGEMAHFNLNPPEAFNLATLAVQLLGSALIIWGPYAWLGAGALAVFTALTIPLVHHFWDMPQPQATHTMYTAVEHLSMIGGLILVSILRHRQVTAAKA